MLQDRFRKKVKLPSGGNDSSLETIDITDQVPQINDVLAEVDEALKNADQLEKQIRLNKPGGHWEYCCGEQTWVED